MRDIYLKNLERLYDMKGKDILLMLSHLFRKCGRSVSLGDAIHHLSFEWRYGEPTKIRKILAVAVENEMISFADGRITAEFIFNIQKLHPNQADILSKQQIKKEDVIPLY